MSDQEFSSIARDIEKSDPGNESQRGENLDQIRELRKVVDFAGAQNLGGFLDAAALLTEYMPHLSEVSPEDVQRIIARLVRMVEVSFQEALNGTEPQPEKKPETGDSMIRLTPVSELPEVQPEAPTPPPAVGPNVDPFYQSVLPANSSAPPHSHSPVEPPSPPPALEQPQAPIPSSAPAPAPSSSEILEDVLLGDVLVRLGTITAKDVEKALGVQAKYGLRFGEALVQLGKALPSEVKKGLDIQRKIRESKQLPDHGRQAGRRGASGSGWRGGNQTSSSLRLSGEGANEPEAPLPGGISLTNEVRQVEELMLGDVMIQQGVITRDQLRNALDIQRASGLQVGEALVEMGAATWDQVKKALRKQEIRRLQQNARYR